MGDVDAVCHGFRAAALVEHLRPRLELHPLLFVAMAGLARQLHHAGRHDLAAEAGGVVQRQVEAQPARRVR